MKLGQFGERALWLALASPIPIIAGTKRPRDAKTSPWSLSLNGREFYLGPYGTAASKAAYDRIVGEWIAAGRMVTASPGGVSLARVMLLYVKHAEQHYTKLGRATSEVLGIKAALRFLKNYIQVPAASIAPSSARAAYGTMRSTSATR